MYNCNSIWITCQKTCSKVISPILSRCLSIRIPAPSEDEIMDVLQAIAKKENITLPKKFAEEIVNNCEQNLRKAILMFEASKVEQLIQINIII
jgi:replication factor C subunit 3/5